MCLLSSHIPSLIIISFTITSLTVVLNTGYKIKDRTYNCLLLFLSAKLCRLDRQQSGTSGDFLPVLFKRRASVS